MPVAFTAARARYPLMADLIPPSAGTPYLTIRATGEKSLLDVPAATIVQAYKNHGALLLRGFTTDLDVFGRFTAQFCSGSVFNESRSRQMLDDARNIQSVSLGTAAFPLHPELSREPWKPDVCFFACLNPPRRLGATTVCDGSALVERLPARTARGDGRAAAALTRGIRRQDELVTWFDTTEPSDAQLADPPARCPFTFRRDGDQIQRSFSRPFLHRPMFTDRPAFGNFLLFARYGIDRWDFPGLRRRQPCPARLDSSRPGCGRRDHGRGSVAARRYPDARQYALPARPDGSGTARRAADRVLFRLSELRTGQ